MNDAENRVRELLHNADPLLTAPSDRVAEIGARVRHTRQKIFLGVCLSALLLFAVGFAAWPQQPRIMPVLGANGCPAEPFHGPWKGDGDGRLVPDDATSITLCDNKKATPQTLTESVGEVTALLNSLPPSDNEPGCTSTGVDSFSLVLKYPQRQHVIALVDINCGQIYVDGEVRQTRPSPVDTFQTLYRQQIAESRPLMLPQCATTVHGPDLRFTGLRDEMADLRGASDPFVHSDLWAFTACEYTGSLATSWKRQRQATGQEALSAWRERINSSLAQPLASCSPDKSPSVVYLLWFVDVTGSVSQLVVTKEPCFAVYAAELGGRELTNKFVTDIEHLLGYR